MHDTRRHCAYPRSNERAVGASRSSCGALLAVRARGRAVAPERRLRQLAQRRIAALAIGETRDPDEDVFAFAHRQAWKVVRRSARFRTQPRNLDPGVRQRRFHVALEPALELVGVGAIDRVDGRDDSPRSNRPARRAAFASGHRRSIARSADAGRNSSTLSVSMKLAFASSRSDFHSAPP